MRYESNILKRLIDTYGVVGNPRYISEIIKEFIVRGKERFPNLFTYQADWLAHIDELGLNPSYTVSYTGQSIYAPNTLERPVKSAILKGCTGYRDIDTGEILETFEEGRNLELVSVKMPVLTTTGKNVWDGKTIFNGYFINGINNTISPHNNRKSILISVKPNTNYSFNKLTSTHIFQLWEKPTTINEVFNYKISVFYNGADKVLTDDRCKYLLFNVYENEQHFSQNTFQVEEGSTITSYEPYKSNILSTSEDVTLRGIGDVKDELDCLTGEVTERIGEIVLDGKDKLVGKYDTVGNTIGFYFNSNIITPKQLEPFELVNTCICDKFKVMSLEYQWTGSWKDEEFISIGGDGRIALRLLSSKASTLDEANRYLVENPITLQYQLKTESIKTVDLTILDQNGQNVKQLMTFNGGTHFNTGSLEGSLIPSVSVSVETDLEETLKMCSLEGNTI